MTKALIRLNESKHSYIIKNPISGRLQHVHASSLRLTNEREQWLDTPNILEQITTTHRTNPRRSARNAILMSSDTEQNTEHDTSDSDIEVNNAPFKSMTPSSNHDHPAYFPSDPIHFGTPESANNQSIPTTTTQESHDQFDDYVRPTATDNRFKNESKQDPIFWPSPPEAKTRTRADPIHWPTQVDNHDADDEETDHDDNILNLLL